ncbi:MAG: hypothetical protein JWN94_1215 [Betaproteobacteria bacterium]|nr:hypothetical protein [Betaproteobacteria bacterium]
MLLPPVVLPLGLPLPTPPLLLPVPPEPPVVESLPDIPDGLPAGERLVVPRRFVELVFAEPLPVVESVALPPDVLSVPRELDPLELPLPEPLIPELPPELLPALPPDCACERAAMLSAVAAAIAKTIDFDFIVIS